jgi:hypothetical protein
MYTVQAIGSMAMLLQWIVTTTKFQYSVLDLRISHGIELL